MMSLIDEHLVFNTQKYVSSEAGFIPITEINFLKRQNNFKVKLNYLIKETILVKFTKYLI